MADDICLVDDIGLDETDAQRVDGLLVDLDGVGTLRGVVIADMRRDGVVVHEQKVNDALARVVENGLRMHGGRVAVRLTRLRHDIADVNFDGFAAAHALGHAVDEQIWHDARIERAGTEEDNLRVRQCLDGRGHRLHMLGEQAHAMDMLVRLRDV